MSSSSPRPESMIVTCGISRCQHSTQVAPIHIRPPPPPPLDRWNDARLAVRKRSLRVQGTLLCSIDQRRRAACHEAGAHAPRLRSSLGARPPSLITTHSGFVRCWGRGDCVSWAKRPLVLRCQASGLLADRNRNCPLLLLDPAASLSPPFPESRLEVPGFAGTLNSCSWLPSRAAGLSYGRPSQVAGGRWRR
jgi:hypothetical protein